MILEGIVTTVSPSGAINVAPMGPRVDGNAAAGTLHRFTLRPFRTSRTFANLWAHGEGVLHVTDDVYLLARAAVDHFDPLPPLRPAARVRGWVLTETCRYHEFRVASRDDNEERALFEAEVVHTERLRDFFGFNRAKHAIIEASILATRTAFLALEEIEAEYRRLAPLIEKTGGDQERAAFAFLRQHLQNVRAAANPINGSGRVENSSRPSCSPSET